MFVFVYIGLYGARTVEKRKNNYETNRTIEFYSRTHWRCAAQRNVRLLHCFHPYSVAWNAKRTYTRASFKSMTSLHKSNINLRILSNRSILFKTFTREGCFFRRNRKLYFFVFCSIRNQNTINGANFYSFDFHRKFLFLFLNETIRKKNSSKSWRIWQGRQKQK